MKRQAMVFTVAGREELAVREVSLKRFPGDPRRQWAGAVAS